MDQLEKALDVTKQIHKALEAEVERARGERALIRVMDVEGLVRRAALRGEFNQAVAQLQQQLTIALSDAANTLGLTEVTVEALRRRLPESAEQLSDNLAGIRSLAAALAELDELNRILGQRALSYVRAYLGAVNPTPSAYDRRGLAPASRPASTTVSRVV
jgi:ABC-type transporter Mla subunit MlaD